MKTQNTAIALSIAFAFVASHGAWAAQKDWKFNDDKWVQVISYGNTPISNDSSSEWGPWSEFIQPAAGPAVPFLAESEGDKYRPYYNPLTPPPSVTPPEPFPPAIDTCPSGKMCGYAIYLNFTRDGWDDHERDRYGRDDHERDRYGRNDHERDRYGRGDRERDHYGRGDRERNHYGRNDHERDGWSYGYWNDDREHDGGCGQGDSCGKDKAYYPATFQVNSETSEFVITPINTSDPTPNPSTGTIPSGTPDPTLEGTFKIYAYMNGLGWTECGSGCGSKAGVSGYYIAGYPTLAGEMDTLRLGKVNAQYTGNEILGGGNVVIDVQFGPATWNGTWSKPGFTAAGTVTNANIQSTSVGGNATSGQVQGTFYGAQAQALAGVSDVNLKNGTRHVDLFATVKQ